MYAEQCPSDIGHIIALQLREIHAIYQKAEELYRLLRMAIARDRVRPGDIPVEWWPIAKQ